MRAWTVESKDDLFLDYSDYLTGRKLLAGENAAIPVRFTAPENTTLVVLPASDSDFTSVRIGMHTDTTQKLFSFLSQHPNWTENLFIEARVLDKNQVRKLEKDPVYQFFLKGRLARSSSARQSRIISFMVPKDIKVNKNQVEKLLQLAYSPTTSSQRLGHRIGWYNAEFLCRLYENTTVNSLIPLLGGVNEFRIGSDTIHPGALGSIRTGLRKEFAFWYQRVTDNAVALDPNIVEKLCNRFDLSKAAEEIVADTFEKQEKENVWRW